MYTTIDIVRQLSGLTDSTKISDSVVRTKIDMANGMFESAICRRYSLPLAYHRQVKLSFSGTGSGADTLTVVVNGTDYDITIFSGMTSEEVVDAFKESAVNSTDFVTILSSENDEQIDSVFLVSKSDSSSLSTASAEVNITDAGGTVSGITGSSGIISDKYSAFVGQIVAEIAAALLLTDSYGIEAEGTPKDGEERLERVQQTLLQLQGGSEELPELCLLDEVTKVELSLSNGNDPNFFPTLLSRSDTDNPTKSKITINGKF